VELSDIEARALIVMLHENDHQDHFPELYDQLQKHFFQRMTVQEFRALVGDEK
jgi:hypothetical protein